MPINHYSENFELSNNAYVIKMGYFTQELLPYKQGSIRTVRN